jgi:hypothetical protein
MSILGTIKMLIEQRYFFRKIVLFFGIGFFWGAEGLARAVGESPLSLEEQEYQEAEIGRVRLKSNNWDHNFAITFGMAQGSWLVDSLGPVSGLEFESKAFFSKFQYSFHLPLYGSFGYVIGSSFGYYWERKLNDSEFHRVSAIHFPGIHLGLAYNFTPFFRIQGGVETYLERLDDLSVTTRNQKTDQDEVRKISLTMRPNFDWVLSTDFFYSINWGVRLEGHFRRVTNTPPAGADGKLIGARLTKKDTWVGLGLIFHLFAT